MSSHDRSDAALRAFTHRGAGPRPTFPLVLASVSVAVLALHLDAVIRYSESAFWAAVSLTIVFAGVVGAVVSATRDPRGRIALALALPAACGALIGVVVQAIVLADVGGSWATAVRDLGGLVDTTEPVTWIASGVVLGGTAAVVVSIFLLLAARALRRIAGHDASEHFGVPFTGAAGLFATVGIVCVDPREAAPLVLVAVVAALTLLVAWLVDGSRMKFLRHVFAGKDTAFEIVPAHVFAADPSLSPIVAAASQAGATSVLVRVATNPGSYRAAAAQPIALVADSAEATILPLRRRRAAALAMLGAMLGLGTLASIAHATTAI